MAAGGQGVVPSVVQLVLQAGKLGQLIELLELSVRLMADQWAVEVDSKDDEDEAEGNHDGGGGDGGGLAWGDAAGAAADVGGRAASRGLAGGPRLTRLFLERQELDPAEQHDLSQEQQRADDSGEGPGQLDVTVHALVGRLFDRVEVVHVAHRLDIGQDAGADHERKQVHGHQHRGAGAEGDKQPRRVVVVSVQLHLHHRHLGLGGGGRGGLSDRIVMAQKLSSHQALGPWVSHLASLSLSVRICIMGIIRPTHLGLRSGRKYW